MAFHQQIRYGLKHGEENIVCVHWPKNEIIQFYNWSDRDIDSSPEYIVAIFRIRQRYTTDNTNPYFNAKPI